MTTRSPSLTVVPPLAHTLFCKWRRFYNYVIAAAGIVFTIGGLAAPLWVAGGAKVPVVPRPLPAGWRVAALATLAANWAYVILHGS